MMHDDPCIDNYNADALRRDEARFYDDPDMVESAWYSNLSPETRTTLELLFSEEEISEAFWKAKRRGEIDD
jgi:hypothetical protein